MEPRGIFSEQGLGVAMPPVFNWQMSAIKKKALESTHSSLQVLGGVHSSLYTKVHMYIPYQHGRTGSMDSFLYIVSWSNSAMLP